MTLTKTKKKPRLLWLKITAIVLAVIVLLFAAATIIVTISMNQKFGRGDYTPQQVSTQYYYSHFESGYPRVNISFTSGENTLQGYIFWFSHTV